MGNAAAKTAGGAVATASRMNRRGPHHRSHRLCHSAISWLMSVRIITHVNAQPRLGSGKEGGAVPGRG